MRRSTEWTKIPRRAPWRRLLRLGFFGSVAGLTVLIFMWLLRTEPVVLDSGDANPVRALPIFLGTLAVTAIVILSVPLLRRPSLGVNHYGLRIRPSSGKTMLIPWSNIEEIAAITVVNGRRTDSYLLLATDTYLNKTDRPSFFDRSVLREANRHTEGLVSGFDLAMRCNDFAPTPSKQLAAIATYAPGHIGIVDRLGKDKKAA